MLAEIQHFLSKHRTLPERIRNAARAVVEVAQDSAADGTYAGLRKNDSASRSIVQKSATNQRKIMPTTLVFIRSQPIAIV